MTNNNLFFITLTILACLLLSSCTLTPQSSLHLTSDVSCSQVQGQCSHQPSNQGNILPISDSHRHEQNEVFIHGIKAGSNKTNINQNITIKPSVIFVLGGPGSGKGTQCSYLKKEFGFVHLSAGDLLREEIKGGSEYGTLISSYIKEGKIVPVEITVKLLKKAMQTNGLEKTFLIDGFPRNHDNLIGWEKIMGDFAEVQNMLFFDCPFEAMEKRIMERSKTSGRADDNPETIKKRFRTYLDDTKPVIDLFNKNGKLRKINANRMIEEISNELKVIFSSKI